MKQNVGTVDALLRISCGLTGMALGTAQMVRHPRSSMPVFVTAMSAMKVAEGVTRFCPMLAMFNTDSHDLLVGESRSHTGREGVQEGSYAGAREEGMEEEQRQRGAGTQARHRVYRRPQREGIDHEHGSVGGYQ
jgi:hypothetical protein